MYLQDFSLVLGHLGVLCHEVGLLHVEQGLGKVVLVGPAQQLLKCLHV